MRIVYVLTSLGMGGAEKQALAVAERMERRGHAIALLVLRPRLLEEWLTELETIHLDMERNPLSAIAGLFRARRFLRNFEPDLIHSHSFHANLFARSLRLVVSHSKVLSTIHNVFEGGRLRMLLYRLTDPLCLQTVAVSEAVARRFVKIRAVPAKRCSVVTNGFDVAEFAPDPARRVRVRNQMGIGGGPGEFIWIAAGRIVSAKDFPNLLRAFRQVRERLPKTELWVAGAEADAKLTRLDDSSENYAFRIVFEHGLGEQVKFLGLRRNMPALLDAADGFVSASAWEGMPLAIGEAMAMEKPVVATDVGGVRELVEEAGMVIPPHNANALAEAMIATMQRGDDERTQVGQTGRARINQHFNIEDRADIWESLYRELLAR